MAKLSAQQPVKVEKGRTAERLGCVESEGTGLDMRSWADQIVVTGFRAMMARSRLARTCTARQPMDSPISDRSSAYVTRTYTRTRRQKRTRIRRHETLYEF